MLTGGSTGEKLFADETLAHALTDEDKHFADLVDGDGARASRRFFVSRHIERQSFRAEPLAQLPH
jgi:hypothetical protein